MRRILNHYEIHGFERVDRYSVEKHISVKVGGLKAEIDTLISFDGKEVSLKMCDCHIGCCGAEVYKGNFKSTTHLNKEMWNYISEYITDIIGLPTVIEDENKWGESNLT